MDPSIPYTACLVGAIALYVLLRRPQRPVRIVAALLGLGMFAWLLVGVTQLLGGDLRPNAFFIIFSLIAVASAVRMITHHKPVYSALYFILVVLSSASLFLLLDAEFIAFALVIVYAGAILITYLFVLMLAQQSPDPNDPTGQPEYDLVPREPAAAMTVGFILLALLTSMIFEGVGRLPPPQSPESALAQTVDDLNALPGDHPPIAHELGGSPHATLAPFAGGQMFVVDDGRVFANLVTPDSTSPRLVEVPAELLPNNVQRVGQALIADFPVSLELAGVILLMAMFGAVVLARRQIELSDDELREAAGLRKFDFHADEPPAPVVTLPSKGGVP